MAKNEGCGDRVANLRGNVIGLPEVCTERAYYMTESYRQTEGEPPVLRRAKAMDNIMRKMSIHIDGGELLVGKSTSKNRGAPIIVELQWEWYLNEMDDMSVRKWDRCAPIGEEEKAKMREFLPYWKNRTPAEQWVREADEDALKNQDTSAFVSMGGVAMHLAHTGVDYEKALNAGFEGIKKEISKELAVTDPADGKKITYLKAAVITLDAVIAYANRYAGLAEEMAGKETDADRKAELKAIAEICRHVPAYPARNFHEALQSMWFVHIGLRIEAPALGITFGRPDQFLYPFYKNDVERNDLSREKAVELLALLLVKMNDMAIIMSGAHVESLGGFPTMAGITLGGVTKDGEDAVNELSYLILDAEQQVGLTVDEVIIRINQKTPQKFIEKACEANKLMHGKLKFISDHTAIAQLVSEGRPVEMARDYILAGCFTPTVPYRCFDTTASTINLLLILELALNNGVSRITGEQIGPQTGDPKQFMTYEDVTKAFRKQAAAVFGPGLKLHSQYKKLYTEYVPQPFQSILFEGCVKKGIDFADGLTAPYLREGHGLAGLVNVGDSLAALKLAVFDKKVASMAELIDALDKNFEGAEKLLQFLKNAPKFGNDIDYADSAANEVVDICDSEIRKYRGFRDAELALCASTGTGHLMLGKQVGATPEGRRAGEPLAEGGISPHQGRNKTGVTTTFNSVAKINHLKIPGGSVFNLRISPSALKDGVKISKFATMLRTFCELGGFHAQFNIVDGEMLREAQREPEKYRDLVVRVATYSALFTELSTQLQNDIIERSEFDQL